MHTSVADWENQVQLVTLENDSHTTAVISTQGAALVKMIFNGVDVVLGFDTPKEYPEKLAYAGAICGRYANRINHGKFHMNGKNYSVSINWRDHHLHGGVGGWTKKLWKITKRGCDEHNGNCYVEMSLYSPDGDEGFPGAVDVSVEYILTRDNKLWVNMKGIPHAETPINMAHHSFWNLDGHDSGNIHNHHLRLGCGYYTPVDHDLIPTGEILSVKDTALDFQGEGKNMGEQLAKSGSGFDHNLVVTSDRDDDGMAFVAELRASSKTSICMKIYSNMPGVQMYSTNILVGGQIVGKNGAVYNLQQGLCLETQYFPDSVNHYHFPCCLYRPGPRIYHQKMVHEFSLQQ